MGSAVSHLTLSGITESIDISTLCASKTWVLTFTMDGRFLGIGSDNGLILVYEVEPLPSTSQLVKPEPLIAFNEHTGGINSLDWVKCVHSEDSINLISSSTDRRTYHENALVQDHQSLQDPSG